jgi:hypothetical protein
MDHALAQIAAVAPALGATGVYAAALTAVAATSRALGSRTVIGLGAWLAIAAVPASIALAGWPAAPLSNSSIAFTIIGICLIWLDFIAPLYGVPAVAGALAMLLGALLAGAPAGLHATPLGVRLAPWSLAGAGVLWLAASQAVRARLAAAAERRSNALYAEPAAAASGACAAAQARSSRLADTGLAVPNVCANSDTLSSSRSQR